MTEKLKHHLRNSGLKVTGPRLAVFEFLREHDPSTVSDIIENYRGKIDRASIYRTVALFRQHGVIQDIVAGGRRIKIQPTDSFDSHHHHLSCLECGKSETVSISTLKSVSTQSRR